MDPNEGADDDDDKVSVGHIIGIIFRDLFIGGKCVFLIIKSVQASRRYFKTYDTILQFEVWFLMFSAFKILILIPNILVTVNINYLFTMFVFNQLMTIVSNYHLHTKFIMAVYDTEHSVRFSLLLTARLFVLFMLVMWAMYPIFGLKCVPDPYPSQLAAIMYLDFFNSTCDLVITCKLPRNLTRIVE